MMPSNASRDDWALALARFTNCLRADWDIPGIRAAIHAARTLGSREDIAIALIELTKRTDLHTPALLAQDGPHWHTGRTPGARVEPARCPKYGHESYAAHNCSACRTADLEPSVQQTERVPGVSAERVRAILDAALADGAPAYSRTPDAAELASGDSR